MSTDTVITIGPVSIQVQRKRVKRMQIAVYPPDGAVKLVAPVATDSDVLRRFAISKLAWIKKHIKAFQEQPRESPREFLAGETFFYKGRRYMLKVVETKGQQMLELRGSRIAELRMRTGHTQAQRTLVVKQWYRTQLKSELPALIEKWEKQIGVRCNSWGVKLMKTKWGACTIGSKRIWLNLELIRKPPVCLEYIICHEMIHLLEPTHNERFISLMNQHMPKWRDHRKVLNSLPLLHANWDY